MCYNIAFLSRRLALYRKRFEYISLPPEGREKDSDEQLPLCYWLNAFEHPHLPVVTANGIVNAQWGLVPEWTTGETEALSIRDKTLNARSETIFEKPAFRNSATFRRCLLGIEGFYEWRLFNGNKYPYWIYPAKEEQFTLGCLYSSWEMPGQHKLLITFTIVTTEANDLMSEIHNTKKRMPLIFSSDYAKKWLQSDLPITEIQSLMNPYATEKMKAHTISRRFNLASADRNRPEAMQPVGYPELNPGHSPTLF